MQRKRDVSVVVAPIVSGFRRTSCVGLFAFSLTQLAMAAPVPATPETAATPVEIAKLVPAEALKAAVIPGSGRRPHQKHDQR